LPASQNRQDVLRDRWAIPSVDQIMVEERAAAFTKRSIKTSAKLAGLKLAVSMMDLTTLEGKDTPGKVAFLCRKACSRSIRAMMCRPARRSAFIQI
jgi:deoxyribose-phosphate aldolase